MNLDDTLKLLALQLQLDPNELIRLAAEDVIGGYNSDPTQARWGIGSLWEVEGKVLYALVRILKPAHCVEIGSLRGCSTAHLATALSVNGEGHLTAVDLDGTARDKFPKHLESVLTGVTGDGLEWLAGQEDESIDILFEDSSHGSDMCASIAALCKTKLAPGGVLIMHDAAHDMAILGDGSQTPSAVGAEVRAGLDRAIANEYRVYLSEPSDCGFAAWQRLVTLKDRLKNPDKFMDADELAYSRDKTMRLREKHKGVDFSTLSPEEQAEYMKEGLSTWVKPSPEEIAEWKKAGGSDKLWRDEIARNSQIHEGVSPLAELLSQETGLPSHLENDVPASEPKKPAKKKPGRKPKSQTL